MPQLTDFGEREIHCGFTKTSQNSPWFHVKVLRPKKV